MSAGTACRAFVILMVCAVTGFAGDVRKERLGTLRDDLAAMPLQDLAKSAYPGFTLPLPWETAQRFEFHIYRPDETDDIAMIVRNDAGRRTIVSAVEFAGLTDREYPEQDCYLLNEANCDGRLCNGVIVGIVRQSTKGSAPAVYTPLAAWVFTLERPRFAKISPEGVVCRPQNYAN